ncbi:MAG: flavodoxin family protein [[Clostridium] innocuum]
MKYQDALNQSGIDTDVFWIGNKPLSGCIACKSCVQKNQCVFTDTVNEFLDIAADYDGFVFGTPVHWGAAAILLHHLWIGPFMLTCAAEEIGSS